MKNKFEEIYSHPNNQNVIVISDSNDVMRDRNCDVLSYAGKFDANSILVVLGCFDCSFGKGTSIDFKSTGKLKATMFDPDCVPSRFPRLVHLYGHEDCHISFCLCFCIVCPGVGISNVAAL